MPTTSTQLCDMTDEELAALASHVNGGGLSVEERAQIHLEGRQEARRIVKGYKRNAIIGFLILLLGVGGVRYADTLDLDAHRKAVVKSGNAIAVKGCNRDFRNALKQRVALDATPRRSTDPVMTERERTRRVNALTPLPDCREARKLTDDPTKKVVVPQPLHEGLLKDPKSKRLVSGE